MYSTDEFIKKCKELVANYTNEATKEVVNVSDIKPKDVRVVWYSKTLNHMKGLFVGKICDGKYYELTYNGTSKEIYMDVYMKQKNIKHVL